MLDTMWVRDPFGVPVVAILMEETQGTLLTQVLEQDVRAVSRKLKLRLLVELLRPLDAMSAAGYVHRNINPSSVAISGTLSNPGGVHAKLAGFGLACRLEELSGEGRPRMAGNSMYTAPEVWHLGEDLSKMDVWSVGRLAFELFVGRPPQMAHVDVDGQRYMVPYKLELDSDEAFQALRRDDRKVGKLIGAMLQERASQRISIPRALKKFSKMAKAAKADLGEQSAVALPESWAREA